MKAISDENNTLLASQWEDSAFVPDKSAASGSFSRTLNAWKAAYAKTQESPEDETLSGLAAAMQGSNAKTLQEQASAQKNDRQHAVQKEARHGEKHHRSEEKPVNDSALPQTPFPAPLAAPMPSAADSPDTTRPTPDQQELTDLLQSVCSKLYVGQPDTSADKGHVMLDVGSMLPGSMVEVARNGAFLHVRLHAVDRRTLQILERSRDRLMEGLSESTDLVVRVDMDSRDEPSTF